MSNAQRYNPRYLRDCDGDWFTTGNEESKDGRYVLHSDYAVLLARHNALELTVKNIKVHFDMLCTHELRQHGFVSPDHDIDFQVFRVLCGYKELMESHNALVEAVAWLLDAQSIVDENITCPNWRRHVGISDIVRAARAEVDRLVAESEGEG